MTTLYVLDVPEFRPIVDWSKRMERYTVTPLNNGYIRVESSDTLEFSRKELGFKPAVWYSCMSGGIDGVLLQFDRDTLRIGPTRR